MGCKEHNNIIIKSCFAFELGVFQVFQLCLIFYCGLVIVLVLVCCQSWSLSGLWPSCGCSLGMVMFFVWPLSVLKNLKF